LRANGINGLEARRKTFWARGLAEKGKGSRCTSQAPSTNTVTIGTSKSIPAPAKPIKLFHSPADSRHASIVDDAAYFRRHPGAAVRNRFPIENEFATAILDQDGRAAVVRIVVIKRDYNGRPVRVARRLSFCMGGRA
jgi:hypothetical protein